LTVNGQPRSAEVPPLKRLLDVLREDLALTGTKEGCGEGECGACSVLLNGELVNSCLVPACQSAQTEVVTIEGLSDRDGLSVLQRTFVECGAAQCGICTPGMIVAAHCFLKSQQPASDTSVREALAGNLCRCTGYQKIIDAVRLAAKASEG
jgi:aerobic-type carbon monoxide dehydrogenase small subunit (CoxS/CutS family)